MGIVYWEWIVPPDECRYTFYDRDKQPISASVRYREGDRGYLTVPEGAYGVTLEVVKGYEGGDCRVPDKAEAMNQHSKKSPHSGDFFVVFLISSTRRGSR